MSERVAILLDGGFVKKKLAEKNGHFPTTAEIVAVCTSLMGAACLSKSELFRVYYYDAPPFEGKSRNPLDGSPLNFSATPQAAKNRSLIDSLELEPNFAVRRGQILQSGWKIGRSAMKRLLKPGSQKAITARDLVPDMQQKGVDIRIGLDIAWISIKRLVEGLILVTGDSDFVAPMKFARKEGLKIYLAPLGHGVRRELKAHADILI